MRPHVRRYRWGMTVQKCGHLFGRRSNACRRRMLPATVSPRNVDGTHILCDPMADWVMISALTTGGGTLVLASATFASVRSANRASRVAERSLLSGLRPLLMPSKPDDPTQKVGFLDHFVQLPGGSATAEVTDAVIYLSMSVRNVGNGIAILHGWRLELSRDLTNMTRPVIEDFHRLT